MLTEHQASYSYRTADKTALHVE